MHLKMCLHSENFAGGHEVIWDWDVIMGTLLDDICRMSFSYCWEQEQDGFVSPWARICKFKSFCHCQMSLLRLVVSRQKHNLDFARGDIVHN